MVDNVKLEIAIQLVAEKIAGIYEEIDKTKDKTVLERLNAKLDLAFVEKEKVAHGDLEIINKIISERRGS